MERLFGLWSKLDTADQVGAAPHTAKLSEDAEAKRWSQNVVGWNLPEAAVEVLYDDLANRPPSDIGFTVLGEIADRPSIPNIKKHSKR